MKGFSSLIAGMWRLADWNMDAGQTLDYVRGCLDLGVTSFDHADIYGDYSCEGLFGEALAREPDLRNRIQLITKCGIRPVSNRRPDHQVKHYDTSRAHLTASVENSLRALRTDRLDLLLLHRPDPLMDADETATALTELKQAGKVLAFGVSNYTPAQLELLQSRLEEPLLTNQVEFSVLHTHPMDDGTLDQCQRLRITPTAWSPLAGGRLFTDTTDRAARMRNTLGRIGAELGLSIDQTALTWIHAHPSHPVSILGTGKIERVATAREALAAPLTRQQWFAIWEASLGHPVP